MWFSTYWIICAIVYIHGVFYFTAISLLQLCDYSPLGEKVSYFNELQIFFLS